MTFQDLFLAYGIPLLKALLIFSLGILFINYSSSFVERLMNKYHSKYIGMISGKLVYYIGLFIVVMMTLENFGINTTQILGAAGIVGVAVGFASQTSVSNIISGAFLIAEKPFVVGDMLKVGTTLGKVVAIDLLSIKLITLDNEYVRIPNEYLVKNSFVNITRFDLRRISVKVGVSYSKDINRTLKVLTDIINSNQYNQNKDKSSSLITSFEDSSIAVTAYMWVLNNKTTEAKSSLLQDIKNGFEKENIDLPFPQIVVRKAD